MTILTATATKDRQEGKMGIAFTRAGAASPLLIKTIKADSIFQGSDLREGMIVETVMGEPMTWKTPKDAADTLRAAEPGPVSIAVRVAMGAIVKDDPRAKLGISLKNSTKMPGIFVSKINDDGAFAGSELQAGQKVLYINDTPCPNDTKKAIALVKDAESTLKIIASPILTPPAYTAAAAATTTTPVVEEKKEEEPVVGSSSGTSRDAPEGDGDGEGEDDDHHLAPKESEDIQEAVSSEEEKGIIDKIFATCIC